MRVMNLREKTMKSQRGFSLLELVVSMGILAGILGYVMAGVSDIQKKANNDINRLGVSQEARQFMDQILRDLRQSGFPGIASFDPNDPSPVTSNTSWVAQGMISFSSTAIHFEGDVDGSGVSEVYIQEIIPAGGCPCKVQRGTVLKSSGSGVTAAGPPTYYPPDYYTELDDVMNQNIFTAYKGDGSAWVSGTDDIGLLTSIGITLYVQSPLPTEGVNGTTYPTATLVSTARVSY